jgi:hypothetical protein
LHHCKGVDVTSQADVDGALWRAHEETCRSLLPVADLGVLHELAADLRPGSGGRWELMPAGCEARRRLLLADVAARGEELSGRAWPFVDDALPAAPDTVPDSV